MCHTWYFGDLPEDHYKVDSEKGDMGEVNMITENIISNTCGTIFKMPAHREDKSTDLRTITR